MAASFRNIIRTLTLSPGKAGTGSCEVRRLQPALPGLFRARSFAMKAALTSAVIVASACSTLLAAEPRREQSPEAIAANKQITRADLAAAYLRLEQAYFARPPEGERRVTVNQGFDQATLAFFKGQNAEAIRTIDGLTASLAARELTPGERACMALRATADPPVWTTTAPVKPTIRLKSLYELPIGEAGELKLELRLVDAQGNAVRKLPLVTQVAAAKQVDVNLPWDVDAAKLKPGLYRLQLGSGEAPAVTAGYVNVVGRASLDAEREANAKRLAAVQASTPALAQALASCSARNELLSDKPSATNSAQFLTDLNALADSVSREIDALVSGQDPYARRLGDYWRVLKVEAGEIPLRVYAPASAGQGKPLPLLVVLHGAGGDENMFLEAYGAGAIKKIADERGLLVASPLTYKFNGNAKNLSQLIASLGDEYAIDKDRIYVLGHSMGGGATASLARNSGDQLAAACCLAGGSFSTTGSMVPTQVVIAELDAVVPVKMLKASAEKAASAGLPLEIRMMSGYGHTLVVGSVLADSVDWLLTHRRDKKD